MYELVYSERTGVPQINPHALAPLSPLHDLSKTAEKHNLPDLPERRLSSYAKPIKSNTQDWGNEIFQNNILSDWVLAMCELMGRNKKVKPVVLSFGPGGCFKEMAIARAGCDVVAIDRNPKYKTVSLRNEYLQAENKKNGKITLYKGDAGDPTLHLSHFLQGRQPDIVIAYNLIHFLKEPELDNFFGKLYAVCPQEALVAIVYSSVPKEKEKDFPDTFINHKPEKVIEAAGKYSFRNEIAAIGRGHVSPQVGLTLRPCRYAC